MTKTMQNSPLLRAWISVWVTLWWTSLLASGAPVSNDQSMPSSSFDAIGILRRYGYIEDTPSSITTGTMSDEALKEAIMSYQAFNGLKVTGLFDEDTLVKMGSPRCGVSDMEAPEAPALDGHGSRPKRFAYLGSRWPTNTISWKPTGFSEKLPEREQWRAFEKAFALWQEAIPRTITYSRHQPDIELKFARGEHGDGFGNRFDGRGRVLAHAYRPGAGLGGDTHFDEDEQWTVNTGRGTDLTTVAVHEFGHALGLAHSSVPGAIMAPYYRYKGEPKLHADDILGIQSLYGVRKTTTTPQTTTPTTTTTTPTTTTTAATTTQEMEPETDFCKDTFRLDAITEGGDGYMYAFRLGKVYKIGPNGLEKGFPKNISQVFPGAPKQHVRAASYVPDNDKVYIFKDLRVWRFTDAAKEEREREGEVVRHVEARFELDSGYPKQITTDSYYRPSAAITLTYKGVSQMFLFSWDYFWEMDVTSERIVPGYPLHSATYFPHAPGLPDAALMNRKGNLMFFKYNSYKFLGHRGLDGKNQPLGADLFGAVCGGYPSISQYGDYADRVFMDPEIAYSPFAIRDRVVDDVTNEMDLSPELWSLVMLRQLQMAIPPLPPVGALDVPTRSTEEVEALLSPREIRRRMRKGRKNRRKIRQFNRRHSSFNDFLF